ncbi:MAG: site-specific integrase [Nocardioides sp.]
MALTKHILPKRKDDSRSEEQRTRWDVTYRCDPGACSKHDVASMHRERFGTGKWKDAKARAAEVETSLNVGTYVDRRNPLTVGEYARQWAAARPHRPSTAARVAGLIDHHLAPTPLGKRRLIDVKPTEVQAWATGRSAMLAPSSTRVVVSLVRSVFAAAAYDRLIPRNPAERVILPRSDAHRIVPLTVEQVRALTAAMPEPCRAMVLTQAGLGLRIGELVGLRVGDVDFLRRVVHVRRQLDRNGRDPMPLKTPKSRRDIPLPAVVADALAAHLAAHPAGEPDALLFTNARHKGWSYSGYHGVFAAAVAKAGLRKGTSTHDLRHHYASVLLAAGESVAAVAERLGNSIALVLSTYGHLLPDREDRTRAAVDDAWGAAAPTAVCV